MPIRVVLIICLCFQAALLPAQQFVVHFGSAKHTLSGKDSTRLDSLVHQLNAEKSYEVKIVGHTDSIGNKDYNKRLSLNRAEAVRQFMQGKHPGLEFELSGKAFSSPAAENMTEEGRTQNRRVTIHIREKKTKRDRWIMPVQTYLIDNGKKNILYTENGCRVIVNPNSFQIRAGDTVRIEITEYNDPVDFIAGGLPMSYMKQEKAYLFHSEQMMKVEAFIRDEPVALLQMLGLECPDLDTTNGVRLYKFRGQENDWVDINYRKVPGKVEMVDILVQHKEDSTTRSFSDTASLTTIPSQKPTDRSQPVAGQKGEEKPEKAGKSRFLTKHRSRFSLKRIFDSFTLIPDTGKTFRLDPDTGKSFLRGVYPDFVKSENAGEGSGPDLLYCDLDLCDSAIFMEMMKKASTLLEKKVEIDPQADFRPYYRRYQSLAYDGMELKCRKNPEELNSVETRVRKRLFRDHLTLEILKYPENPEYEPFRKTKWIVRYGKDKSSAVAIANAKVSDFRIIPFKRQDYSRKIKEGYFIELKSEHRIFRFPARPKGRKMATEKYKNYRDLYVSRVHAFDDSISGSIQEYNLEEYYCLYLFMNYLTESRTGPCHQGTLPPCIKGNILEPHFSGCSRVSDCFSPYDRSYSNRDCFAEWLNYYYTHIPEMKKRVGMLQSDPEYYWSCLCESNPCIGKWEYTAPQEAGDTIVLIGLGIYNFDRLFQFREKQVIENPVFITQAGDTVAKCQEIPDKNGLRPFCGHTLYSVIAGINGLLKHNYLPSFALLPDQMNILLLEKDNKKYKAYVDLSGRKSYEGSTFIVTDVTEASRTMDGLRKELLELK